MAKPTAQDKAPPTATMPAAKKKAAGSAAPAKRRTDWEAVERDYRTGKFTLRELEAKHGATNSTIARWAKRNGWSQDLSAAVRQATNAALITEIVGAECSKAQQNAADTVLAAAEVNKQVILAHRSGLQSLTAVKHALLNQIAQAAELMPDLADVIEMVRNPDDNGIDRANDALRKAMSRSALVDDLKKLADVDEKVRKGEREAFGLDVAPEDAGGPASTKSMTDAERAIRLARLLSTNPDAAAALTGSLKAKA